MDYSSLVYLKFILVKKKLLTKASIPKTKLNILSL